MLSHRYHDYDWTVDGPWLKAALVRPNITNSGLRNNLNVIRVADNRVRSVITKRKENGAETNFLNRTSLSNYPNLNQTCFYNYVGTHLQKKQLKYFKGF